MSVYRPNPQAMQVLENMPMRPRFPIGLKFVYYADKMKRERVIKDILTLTNSAGTVLRIEYECAHIFCGQEMLERFIDTAIARSLDAEALTKYVK